jgi:hypothetical protein
MRAIRFRGLIHAESVVGCRLRSSRLGRFWAIRRDAALQDRGPADGLWLGMPCYPHGVWPWLLPHQAKAAGQDRGAGNRFGRDR